MSLLQAQALLLLHRIIVVYYMVDLQMVQII